MALLMPQTSDRAAQVQKPAADGPCKAKVVAWRRAPMTPAPPVQGTPSTHKARHVRSHSDGDQAGGTTWEHGVTLHPMWLLFCAYPLVHILCGSTGSHIQGIVKETAGVLREGSAPRPSRAQIPGNLVAGYVCLARLAGARVSAGRASGLCHLRLRHGRFSTPCGRSSR